MHAFGEYPSVVEESGLSQILEEEVPLKYFLSAVACRGVLRRAERRGKKLPEILETALNRQIERWEKFGTPLPLNVLIEEHAQRKAEGVDLYNQQTTGNVSKNLTAVSADADHVPCVICYCFDGEQVTSPTHSEKNVRDVCHTLSRTGAGRVYCVYDARGNGDGETVNTMTGDHNHRIPDYTALVCSQIGFNPRNGSKAHSVAATEDGSTTLRTSTDTAVVYCLMGNCIDRADSAKCNGCGVKEGESYTLNTVDKHGVCYAVGNGQADQTGLHEVAGALNCMHDQQAVLIKMAPIYLVRRLTPLECCRLQGMPDWWIDGTNGSDAAQYKMWGNGMALPNALYVMEGFAEIEGGSK